MFKHLKKAVILVALFILWNQNAESYTIHVNNETNQIIYVDWIDKNYLDKSEHHKHTIKPGGHVKQATPITVLRWCFHGFKACLNKENCVEDRGRYCNDKIFNVTYDIPNNKLVLKKD